MPTILTIANLPPGTSSSTPTASSPFKVKSNPLLHYLQWKPNIWLSPTPRKKLSSSPNSSVPSKSIYLDQLSSTPTPSPLSITSRTTSCTLARSTSMFVTILFAMPAPAITSLYNTFLQHLKSLTFLPSLSDLQSTLKLSKCLNKSLLLRQIDRKSLSSSNFYASSIITVFGNCNSITAFV